MVPRPGMTAAYELPLGVGPPIFLGAERRHRTFGRAIQPAVPGTGRRDYRTPVPDGGGASVRCSGCVVPAAPEPHQGIRRPLRST
jgi:hypothetical protein